MNIRGYLELVRIPNLPTAAADPLAGFFFASAVAGSDATDYAVLVRLAIASVFLYAGGVALNDACDASQDAQLRPTRPIPSARISRSRAMAVSILMLALGCITAATVSINTAGAAIAIVLFVVAYDTVGKTTPLGPLLMGACRALNLSMGIVAAGTPWNTAWIIPAGLMALYVTSVTIFARRETTQSSSLRLRLGTLGVCAATLGLLGLSKVIPSPHSSFIVLVLALATLLTIRGLSAARTGEPRNVQRAVEVFVPSIILFDACVTWAAAGAVVGIAIATLLVPTLWLRTSFRVT